MWLVQIKGDFAGDRHRVVSSTAASSLSSGFWYLREREPWRQRIFRVTADQSLSLRPWVRKRIFFAAIVKIFSSFYRRAMSWARHRHAPWFLGIMSFAESSFFPVPPDVMLAPMCLAQPRRAFAFAFITTLASVLGGLFGYLIGAFAFEAIEPMLRDSHYWAAYSTAVEWFERWGFWAMFVAGFSPIPYKVFTIAAGALSMALLPFTLASAIGRGCRFFLVAGLMAWGGERMEAALHRYVDRIGWATVAVVAIGAALYQS
jgi:membrane protein YqaA with SNARE-associated domain